MASRIWGLGIGPVLWRELWKPKGWTARADWPPCPRASPHLKHYPIAREYYKLLDEINARQAARENPPRRALHRR